MLSLFLTFFSSAISPTYADVPSETAFQPITINIDSTHKQLKFTRCNDLDDWYLDGYTTARSFPNHKETFYNGLVQHCEKFMVIDQKYIDQWNDGFNAYGKVKHK